jgi:AraC family transcriptional regulator of adaptative response/methylated-DNA-[protein]-cysteine methyltransferase
MRETTELRSSTRADGHRAAQRQPITGRPAGAAGPAAPLDGKRLRADANRGLERAGDGGGRLAGAEAEAAWAAVMARDSEWDGRCVYAVASTGVFCRPTCAAKRPRRERTELFRDAAAAEAAGYRACKRCRPTAEDAAGAGADAERKVATARDYLAAHLDEAVTLARLGREVGASPYHLQRTFKKLLGLTPKEYVLALRAERLKARLRKGDDVTTATYEAGYGAGSRLYEQSNARLGMTPGTFRRGGTGTTIRYALAGSTSGRLLVAATDRGICAVRLGDDDEEMAAALRRDYPQAAVEPVAAGDPLQDWVDAILASMSAAGPSRAALQSLPLDVRATAFEWRVWRELQRIPRGATRSYGEVAAALGQPTAARAVARACAANPVALLVPCHRVVRAGGEPGGYRWGADRKRQLLAGETAPPAPAARRG